MLCPVALFNPTVDLCDLLQLLICHGVSVEKSPEGGDLGERLLMPAVSVGTCQPGCLNGDGEVLPHGLGAGLCLAPCPYDLAGLEAGGGGHDHGSVCRLN